MRKEFPNLVRGRKGSLGSTTSALPGTVVGVASSSSPSPSNTWNLHTGQRIMKMVMVMSHLSVVGSGPIRQPLKSSPSRYLQNITH